MISIQKKRTSTIILTSFLAMLLPMSVVSINTAHGETTTRDISDFVDQQGTFQSTFDPPIGDFLSWTDEQNRCMVVDYAGIVNQFLEDNEGISLGTTTSGTITERSLNDGTSKVHVILHTTDALTWVYTSDDPCAEITSDQATPLFGASPDEVANGADAALGNITLNIKFINQDGPGADLPDLVEFLEGDLNILDIDSIIVSAQADGQLREASGFDEGTTGKAKTTQTILIKNVFTSGNLFPVENINIHPVGN